jgi:hypothetical protein
MFAETFAFNMEEQQEVINKYYQVGDATDLVECRAKRPRRAIDPREENHCLAAKQIPFQPAGR